MGCSLRRFVPLVVPPILLAACGDLQDVPPAAPESSAPVGPSFATSDGSVAGGNPDFFFLSPLAFEDPAADPDFEPGEFNGHLPPYVTVCELRSGDTEFLGSTAGFEACATDAGAPIAEFSPSDVKVSTTDEHYHVNLNTGDFRGDRFYRLLVHFGEEAVLGWRDLEPVDSNPGVEAASEFDFYRFSLGSNIAVKFRIENRALCSGDAGAECAAAAVFDSDGGTVATQRGAILLAQGSLPGEGGVVAVIVEEVALGPGEECLELGLGSDAEALGLLLAGPCFRIRTEPPLEEGFTEEATVCLEVEVDLAALGLTEEQEHLFQIHRQDEEVGAVFSLPTAACPENVFVAASDGEDGLLRMAREGLAAVRRSVFFWVEPLPLYAAHLGLGGQTRFTSRFQWALPAWMAVEAGNVPTQVVPPNSSVPIPPSVLVLDADNEPVAGATVDFSAAGPKAGDVVSPARPLRVTTDAAGVAAATDWTLGEEPGLYELAVRGIGIGGAAGPFAEPAGSDVELEATTLTFTAIVCDPGFGAPDAIDGIMDPGEWGCAHSAAFTANLSGGPGVPAEVFWMNDEDSLYLAVRVEHSDDRANELGFNFDNDGDDVGGVDTADDGLAEVGDDVLLVTTDHGEPGDFGDLFVTSGCVKKGQALCGDLDDSKSAGGSSDGSGAFHQTATTTTYELSHPLASGDSGHDFELTAGDTPGFFLTLRLGKGAQGNTQWPGFQEYQEITIEAQAP